MEQCRLGLQLRGLSLGCGIQALVRMARCPAQPQRAALILEQAKQGKLLQACEGGAGPDTNGERTRTYLLCTGLGLSS